MQITALDLPGAYLVDLATIADDRGFFARSFCAEEFAAAGLDPHIAQCSISHNRRRGTLRGLHYQASPFEEAKLVRCTAGSIFDVIVDLRRDSPTRGRWAAAELSAENRRALYIPRGFAHGFQALEDDCEVFYQISVPYHPESSRGIRWNDPEIGIIWPLPDEIVISSRDRQLPLLRDVGT